MSSQHFTLCNLESDGGHDLPRLLRRVADEIERREINPKEILDLILTSRMTAAGPWWSVSVYTWPDDVDDP